MSYSREVNVKERNGNIIKAPSDKRLYRGLKLENDMKILLISDPSAKKSAASLTVGVGGLNDFVKVQGLANLVGYSLMNGSQTYPIPYDFCRFFEKHDGDYRLPTTQEHVQQFSFDIDPGFLVPALDRLAKSFSEPLLLLDETKEYFLNEALNMVAAEILSRGMKDKYRVPQVEKTLCHKNNPYCNLFNGSKKTLFQHAEDPRNTLQWKESPDPGLASLFAEVRQFYKNWYSSSNMSLVVLGRESLNRLEEITVPLFANLQRWRVPKFVYGPTLQPWGKNELGYVFYINPIRGDEHHLRLNFPALNTDVNNRTKPEIFISELLKYDGPNSLLFVLRKKRLVFDLDTEYMSAAGIAFFRITCQLTEHGLKQVGSIINMIFQYIHLIELSDKNTLRERFIEIGNIFHASFLDGAYVNASSLDQVESLSRFMQEDCPTENVLTIGYFMDQWDETLVEKFLECIEPSNMNVSIVSSTFLVNTNEMEIHYETFYRKEKISQEVKELLWTQVQLLPELKLRPRNEFVPENFYFPPSMVTSENVESKHPNLLHMSSKTEIWYKQDEKFKIPRLHVLLQVHSWTSSFGPNAYALWYFVCHTLKYSLNEDLSDAKTAGFGWKIEVTPPSELTIELFGYDDKLPLLLEKILSKFIDSGNDIDERYFNTMVREYFEDMKKSITKNHVYKMDWFLQCTLLDDWTAESVYNSGIKLRYEDLKKFLSKRFRRIFVRGLVHGNCSKEKAMMIVNIVEKTFQSSNGLLLQEILRTRTVEMAGGSHYIYETSNEIPDQYAYNAVFQVSTNLSDLKTSVASLLFYKAIQDLCAQILFSSDKKQVVKPSSNCELKNFHNMRAFLIIVTSEKNPGYGYVDKSVETFLQEAIVKMSTLSDKEFLKVKNFIWEEELKISDLYDLTKKYWFDIKHRSYNFDRAELQLDLLHSMTTSDCVNVLRKILTTSAPQRSQLVVHMSPRNVKDVKSLPPTMLNKITKVQDSNDFRIRLNLPPISA